MNIGESIPQDSLNAINLAQPADTGFELISLLNSVKLSMQVSLLAYLFYCFCQGVKITVSTPLLTAVRFSTGNKIEMLITNVSHQHDTHILANKNHLTLHGKVETEINVALGCIQVSLCLLYFIYSSISREGKMLKRKKMTLLN